MQENDDIYALIAMRVSDYQRNAKDLSEEALNDLSISLSSVFDVSKEEVKLIINDVFTSYTAERTPRDIFLDKAISYSKDIILLIIFFIISSFILF